MSFQVYNSNQTRSIKEDPRVLSIGLFLFVVLPHFLPVSISSLLAIFNIFQIFPLNFCFIFNLVLWPAILESGTCTNNGLLPPLVLRFSSNSYLTPVCFLNPRFKPQTFLFLTFHFKFYFVLNQSSNHFFFFFFQIGCLHSFSYLFFLFKIKSFYLNLSYWILSFLF